MNAFQSHVLAFPLHDPVTSAPDTAWRAGNAAARFGPNFWYIFVTLICRAFRPRVTILVSPGSTRARRIDRTSSLHSYPTYQNIVISGLAATILDLSLPIALCGTANSAVELEDLENMGFAIEISTLSSLQAEI